MGNSNSGRRPAPTALKILRGKPIVKRGPEPVPPPGPVVMPEGLSEGARVAWRELAPVVLAMGTLTRADAWAFQTLCELWATLEQVQAAKRAAGYLPIERGEDATGGEVWRVHPLVKLERETAAAVRLYFEAFGLHPAARSRLTAPGAAVVSKWA